MAVKSTVVGLIGKRRVMTTLLVVTLVASGAAAFLLTRESRSALPELRLARVERGRLPLYVVERGRLESQNVIEIKCGVPRGADRHGVRIVYIVPNGARVKKGDLLVEFDSSWVRDTRYKVLASYYRTNAYKIWRDSSYEKEVILSQIRLIQAKLDLDRAKLLLQQFENEAGGRFAMDLQAARMDLEEALALLAEAQTRLLLERTRLEGVRMLYEKGYRGKGDLDQATFAFLQARDMLTRAQNAVKTAEANILKLKKYIYPELQLELTSAVRNAELQLKLVQQESAGKLAELAAWKDSAQKQLDRVNYWLQRFDRWLEACRVYSPVDGIAIYNPNRTPWRRHVGEGELVYYRMTVLTIPDLAHMQVELKVHEAVLDELREGQTAEVYVDGIPDRVYRGTVSSIDRTPDRGRDWHERSVNVYEVVVKIDGEVERLNPGMTASVRIKTGEVVDALLIPVTAAFQRGGHWWCFVMERGKPRPRRIVPGRSNDRSLQVVDGLQVNETVVVNPYDLPISLFPPDFPPQDGYGAGTEFAGL